MRMTNRDATKIVTSPASIRKFSARSRIPVRQPLEAGTEPAAVRVGLDIATSLRGALLVPGCTDGHDPG